MSQTIVVPQEDTQKFCEITLLAVDNFLSLANDSHMEDNNREGRVVATIPTDTFAHRLLLVRAQMGHLTVKDAAEKCGLHPAAWAKWEQRGSLPRDILDVTEAIADGLNVDRDWLLHGGPLTAPVRPARRVRLTYPRRSLRPGGRGAERRARRLERVPA